MGNEAQLLQRHQKPRARERISPDINALTTPGFEAIVPTVQAQNVAHGTQPTTAMTSSTPTRLSRLKDKLTHSPLLTGLITTFSVSMVSASIAAQQVTCARCWYTKVLPAFFAPMIPGSIITVTSYVALRFRKIKHALAKLKKSS